MVVLLLLLLIFATQINDCSGIDVSSWTIKSSTPYLHRQILDAFWVHFPRRYCVKVRSHGAAMAVATVPLSIGFHWCAANYSIKMYVAAAAATQNGVGTHLLAAPLPQPHQCEQVHLIQWNPIDSGTVAAAVAAPCERTFSIIKLSAGPISAKSLSNHMIQWSFSSGF